MSTRFGPWRAAPARALLAALVALILGGLLLSARPIPPDRFTTVDPMRSDGALYGAVAARVAAGEGYYDAVVAEHRTRHYPLRPFVAVRLPTLAWLVAALGPFAASMLLNLLVVGTVTALGLRLRGAFATPLGQAAGAACAALGAIMLANPDYVIWHEVWAGLLIALSLACRSERRFAPSLAFGLAAVAIRELAAPYLAVMAVVAMLEGRRREAAAWVGAIALFGGGLALHAHAVAAHVAPDDLASPGWTGLGGWRLVLTMIRAASALDFLPMAVAAIVVPLCLLGWGAWRSPTGLRGTLALGGYASAFMVVGRENNAYWGLVLAPLLFTGLAFAPAALRDLWRAADLRRVADVPFRPHP